MIPGRAHFRLINEGVLENDAIAYTTQNAKQHHCIYNANADNIVAYTIQLHETHLLGCCRVKCSRFVSTIFRSSRYRRNALWRVGASRVGGWLSCSRGWVVFSVGVVNGRFFFRVWVVNRTWRWIGVNCGGYFIGGVGSSVVVMKRLHAFAAEMFL
jgi:hypothetical protein